ncbi:hypothetical protein ACFXHA_02230 [Nocardia sp. NPDC059240]|uniref:hypothetical protein n=1 Tax=Nocardia sp. NPDC059240 TaxID=3346786 RepID=UPI0036920E57
MIDNEQLPRESRGVWRATREWRRGLAIVLASAGAIIWCLESMVDLFTSDEPKFDNMRYFGWTATEVLQIVAVCFGLISVALGVGVVMLCCRLLYGRYLLIGTSALVLAGQALAVTLASIPIDEFYYSHPSSLAFTARSLPFPLLTIILLLGKQHEY